MGQFSAKLKIYKLTSLKYEHYVYVLLSLLLCERVQ